MTLVTSGVWRPPEEWGTGQVDVCPWPPPGPCKPISGCRSAGQSQAQAAPPCGFQSLQARVKEAPRGPDPLPSGHSCRSSCGFPVIRGAGHLAPGTYFMAGPGWEVPSLRTVNLSASEQAQPYLEFSPRGSRSQLFKVKSPDLDLGSALRKTTGSLNQTRLLQPGRQRSP